MEIFTDVEKQILKGTNKSYKWIARDKDGKLYLYEMKPYRYKNECIFNTDNLCFHFVDKCVSDVLFKNVTWENSPIQFRDDDELLTPKEREYFKLVFKPFASDIMYVQKMRSDDIEYIVARVHKDVMTFPCFAKGIMYKGMKPEVKYTLKELGIVYNE